MLILHAVFNGLSELADGQSRNTIFLSVLITAALLIGTIIGGTYIFTQIPLVGVIWIDNILQTIFGISSILLSWFLFPLIATAIVSLFLDQICKNIEQREYKTDFPGQSLGTISSILEATRFLLLAFVINLLVFALGLIITPFSPFLYFIANGYLISREYFFQVGMRYSTRHEVQTLYNNYRISLLIAGSTLTMMLLVPILNLCVPVIAVATMVHAFKGAQTANAI